MQEKKNPFFCAPLLMAAGIFFFFLIRPAYIVHLRNEARLKTPEQWAQWPMNGSFAVLLPEIFASRYHDEALYSARVHQILLHGTPSDPYWQEDKGRASWIHDCLSLYILAAVDFLCGGNISIAWIVAAALVGALWFLLFHAVFKWWSGKEEVAVPLALFSILFPDLYTWLLDINFSPALNRERYASVFFQRFSEIRPNFYRLPSNFLSMLLLGFVFLGTWRLACRNDKKSLAAILLGFAYGLMTLVHAYAFTFGMATLSLFTAAQWAVGSRKAARWNLALCLAGSMMIAGIYALVMAGSMDSQTRADSLEIIGLVHSHKFYFISLIHLLAAAFGYWQLTQETDDRRRAAWLLLACSQAAIFLCRNSQVATGLLLQPFHFIPLGSFTGCLMLFLCLADFLSRRQRWNKKLGAAAALLILAWALMNEKAAAERTYQFFGFPRDIEAGLQWVQSIPGDPLILSLSMETNELVPIYTAAKVQVPPAAPNNSAPFSKEKYFYKTAQLLKTCHADPDLFLRERWLTPKVKNEFLGRYSDEMTRFGKVDLAAFEPAEWFYQFWWNNESDLPILQARERIKTLYQQVPPVEKPFYLWVNAKDSHLFLQAPPTFGGKLVYQNSSVKIYEFSYASSRAASAKLPL